MLFRLLRGQVYLQRATEGQVRCKQRVSSKANDDTVKSYSEL
jgi:hypothetical protein